jgi:outer membrane protein assembly factor BamB
MNAPRSLLLAGLLAAALGCGAQSFQARFQPPNQPGDRALLAEIAAQKPRDERPVAVGITSEPQRLFAWDLSAGLLWERPIKALSAPLVAADAIVTREADGIVVRDLASGEVRVVVDDHGDLVGADGQGHAVVISISYGEASPRGAIALVDGDSLRWKQSLKLPVGVPALVGRYALVPWATQTLSVLSTRNGEELARWVFNKSVVGHALVDRGRVYVGQHRLMRVDQDALRQAAQVSATIAPIDRPLPGQPPLLRDGYLKVPEPENAYHRLQASWRTANTDAGPIAENDALFVRFYRMLFSIAAGSDEIRWVRTFDHDLIGAAIQPGGVFVADTAGTLRFIDSAGAVRTQRDLGRPLQVVTIRPGAWVPADGAEPSADKPLGALHEQLFAAAALEDDRLGAGRAYAVEYLGRIGDAAVTADLIALCENNKSPEPVWIAACSQLGQRKSGGDLIVQAMRRRASFLDGVEGPPVGPLAQAAGEMQLKPAGALLITHMEDPNTKARDLPAVFGALEKLNQRSAASAIERFVRLHHAEPEGSELTPALYAALHALGGLRARSARLSLEDIANDEMTTKAVREHAREALGLLDAPAVPKQKPRPEPEPEEDESDEPQTDPRPYALTAPMVRAALTPMRKPLSQCVASDATHPRSARLSLVVQGEGRVEGIFVTPTTLQACMEPLLRDAKFPATRVGRQRITHVVFGPNAPAAAPAAPARKAKAAKAAKPAAPAAAKPPASKPAQ